MTRLTNPKEYRMIGLMSGTSLDGLDLCYAHFTQQKKIWDYELLATQTIEYPADLREKLQKAIQLSGEQLFFLDKQLGDFFGDKVNEFMDIFHIDPKNIDALCSHGHTVFHQPEKQFTVQIACGESIAQRTGIRTINDFRKKDVLLGGQGAPFAPLGDFYLFSEHADTFLNIGGFANFSKINTDGTIMAADICPANNLINFFAQKTGFLYDDNGMIARSSLCDDQLLTKLNNLPIYSSPLSPSMGWENVQNEYIPLFEQTKLSIEQKIATATQHAVDQISKKLNQHLSQQILVSGGGAKNTFLIEQIAKKIHGKLLVPDPKLIDFKEALIFAFLGVLHLEGIPTSLLSVTHAHKESVGGVMHMPG